VLYRVEAEAAAAICGKIRPQKIFLSTFSEEKMNNLVSMLSRLHKEESGQDLIEYALVVALIALAATAGMSTLAGGINTAFSKLGSILNAYI
jgi:pilus assembly protein Flp/PilA